MFCPAPKEREYAVNALEVVLTEAGRTSKKNCAYITMTFSIMKKFFSKNQRVNLIYALIAITLIMISILVCKLMSPRREALSLFGLGDKNDNDKIKLDATGSNIERFERMTSDEQEPVGLTHEEETQVRTARKIRGEGNRISEELKDKYRVSPSDGNKLEVINYFDPIPSDVLSFIKDTGVEKNTKKRLIMEVGNKSLDTEGASSTQIGNAMNKVVDSMWRLPASDMSAMYQDMQHEAIIEKQGSSLLVTDKRTSKSAILTTENFPLKLTALLTAIYYKGNALPKPTFTSVEPPTKTITEVMDTFRATFGSG
jgi:hypothetical protein